VNHHVGDAGRAALYEPLGDLPELPGSVCGWERHHLMASVGSNADFDPTRDRFLKLTNRSTKAAGSCVRSFCDLDDGPQPGGAYQLKPAQRDRNARKPIEVTRVRITDEGRRAPAHSQQSTSIPAPRG